MILYIKVQQDVTKVLTGAKVNQILIENYFSSIFFYCRNLIHQQKKFDILFKMIIQEKKQVSLFYLKIDVFIIFVVDGEHSLQKKVKK
jgi:hypothetical protein